MVTDLKDLSGNRGVFPFMIIRTEKNSHYTTICNDALNDPNLTLKAKGLWAFIMSKPDEWAINYRGLSKQLKEGQGAILAALKELETTGYLVRGQIRNTDGTFTQTDATLYERPCVKNSRTDNSRVDSSRTKVNTKQVNTDKDIDTKVSMGAEAPVDKKNTEVEQLFSFWALTTGLPIQSQVQRNRKACYSLIQSLGSAEIRKLTLDVKLSQSDVYAPVITDFITLQAKLSAFHVWEQRRSPAPKTYPNVGAMLHPDKYKEVAHA